MAGFSNVIFMGNVTRDPELKSTGGGAVYARFGVAINRKWTDKTTGEVKDEVCFVDVTLWNKAAENAGQYLRKGDPVLIEGHLKTEQWTDKASGAKRSRLSISCDRWQYVGPPRKRENSQESPDDSQPA